MRPCEYRAFMWLRKRAEDVHKRTWHRHHALRQLRLRALEVVTAFARRHAEVGTAYMDSAALQVHVRPVKDVALFRAQACQKPQSQAQGRNRPSTRA